MKYIYELMVLMTLVLATSCGNRSSEQSRLPVNDFAAKIDSLIETTSPRLFNGVVLISKEGKVNYAKEMGFSNFEDKTPIKLTDNFRIQSNSKQITAVLILKEVEKGNINLQNTIRNYLPDLKQSWADSVTVHQLLNMSSGIVDIEEPLLFEAGKGYKYSNPGYGLLGRIIENVSGQEYTIAANNLFKELGMDNTYCYALDSVNNGLVNGYWIVNGKVELVDFENLGFTSESWKHFIPAGGIISNVYDMTKWDAQLHNGTILGPEFYNLLVKPSNSGPHAAFANDTIGYAYGLRIHAKHSTPHLGHGGRGLGFVCIKFYIPEADVAVIIWENIYSRDPNFMAGDIVYHFENEIRKIVVESNLVE